MYGAHENADFYVVAGEEQRSIGRALSSGRVLLVEGLAPGAYSLVESRDGKETSWEVTLQSGSQSFDLRTGDFR